MLGQLAQQKGGSDKARTFGKTLVTDHTTAKQEASAVAKTLGVAPPDQPMPEARDEQAKLSKMSGDDFDREFASYMVTDHKKDIQEFQDQAKANDGKTSALASKQLPVLQKHLEMAQALAGNAAQNGASPAVLGEAPTQEPSDQWRASKLAGVAVYGPDNKKVGNITDILISKDGKAESVVVGVGGFLGIGEKDVAIPYEQVKFTDQPFPTSTGSAANPDATTSGATASEGGVAPAMTLGLGTAPADVNGNAGAARNRSTAYPDHGMIEMTADQLKKAPTFHFAP